MSVKFHNYNFIQKLYAYNKTFVRNISEGRTAEPSVGQKSSSARGWLIGGAVAAVAVVAYLTVVACFIYRRKTIPHLLRFDSFDLSQSSICCGENNSSSSLKCSVNFLQHLLYNSLGIF